MTECPLCRKSAQIAQVGSGGFVQCVRCGDYVVEGTFVDHFLKDASDDERGLLSVVIRKAFSAGEEIHLTFRSHEALRARFRPLSVSARRTRVLEYLSRNSAEAGAALAFPTDDLYPVFECKTGPALGWIVESLAESGEVRKVGAEVNHLVRLTAAGWNAVESSLRSFVPGTCFVAMWFDSSMDSAYEAIEAAIETDCEMVALRVDKEHHTNRVDDYIVSKIRAAECLIADFTGDRGGVYFEAGYALALDRPVVWACKRGWFESTPPHFDVNHFPFILWDSPAHLRTQLTTRLRRLGLARKLV